MAAVSGGCSSGCPCAVADDTPGPTAQHGATPCSATTTTSTSVLSTTCLAELLLDAALNASGLDATRLSIGYRSDQLGAKADILYHNVAFILDRISVPSPEAAQAAE